MGGGRRQVLGIPRQHPLQAVQQVDDEEAGENQDEHRGRVGLPAHVLVGADAADPVDQALDAAQGPIDGAAERLAFEDASHEAAERPGERGEDDEVEGELEIAVGGHQNFSGLNIATNR